MVPCSRSRSVITVRAENLIRGCDQQSCHPYRPAVMITDHVPAVRLPPDYADGIVAAAVSARGSMAGRRDPAPAPPADRPATAAAAPPEPELGGPGPDRVAVRCDTESPPPRASAAGHPGHDRALAPRHRSPPLGRQVRPRQDRQAGHSQEHQVTGAPAGPREPRMGIPRDPRGAGRPGSENSGVDGVGNPEEGRNRPCAATDRAYLGAQFLRSQAEAILARLSSRPTCSTAPRLTSWP